MASFKAGVLLILGAGLSELCGVTDNGDITLYPVGSLLFVISLDTLVGLIA